MELDEWGVIFLVMVIGALIIYRQTRMDELLPDWMWAYDYPNNVINAGIPIEGCIGNFCHRLPYPVFPTAIYEVMMGLALFAFLWSIRKRIKIPGILFGVYLILNGLERFSIEKNSNKYYLQPIW